MSRSKMVTMAVLAGVVFLLMATGVIDVVGAYNSMMDFIKSLSPAQQFFAITFLTMFATVSGVISTSPVNLLAGSLLGVPVGSLSFLLGAVGGACLGFALGRSFLKDFAEKQLRSSPKLSALAHAMGQGKGFLLVTLARLSPVFPYAIVSYAFGAVPTLPALTHASATFLGSIPGVCLYAYIGSTLKAASDGDGEDSQLTLWISLAATVVTIAAISMVASRVLDEATAKAAAE